MLSKVTEVPDQIRAALDKVSHDLVRELELERHDKEIVARCEQEPWPGTRCGLVSLCTPGLALFHDRGARAARHSSGVRRRRRASEIFGGGEIDKLALAYGGNAGTWHSSGPMSARTGCPPTIRRTTCPINRPLS